MPRVSDYSMVVGPNERAKIGDHGVQDWDETFTTGGAVMEGNAYFLIEFKGLQFDDPAPVILNGNRVGRLAPYNDWETYHTQIVDFGAGNLNRQGQNRVEINAITHGGKGSGNFDNFQIENMVCHYHQEA